MTEAELQRWTASYLDSLGLLWCHVANERHTSPRRGAELKRQGVKPGVPDVLIFAPFKSYSGLALELKAKRGRLTKSQNLWLAMLEGCGWRAKVCRSVDEVRAIVRECYGRG
jgi:hypothetical protein